MVTLRNAVDTYTDAARANKNYGQTNVFRTRTGGAGNQFGWLFFGTPGFPKNAQIQSATLYLYNKAAQTGANTVTVRRADAKWRVNRLTDSIKPGVVGSSATLAKTAAAADTEWQINVTALMQEVATSGNWWGFRIAHDTATSQAWHSAQATDPDLRPMLVVLWKQKPNAPTELSPSGTRAVAKQFPDLSFDFDDPGGDQPMASFQVQIDDAADFVSVLYDSLEIASATPTFITDSTSTGYITPPGGAWTGITAGTTRYWRVRVKDSNGQWSDWSAAAPFKRVDKVLPVITNPAASPNNFVWEPTPPFTYTYAGAGATAQVKHQILVVNAAKLTQEFYDSGVITTTTLSETPAKDALTDTTLTYRLIVRVWDATDRERNGTDPIYSEVFRDFTYNYDNTVTAVSSLAVTQLDERPIARLTWTRATAPDSFVIMRDDIVVEEATAAELLVSGTNYRYDDTRATARDTHTWEVTAVVNTKQSLVATASGTMKTPAPVLMRRNGADACVFLNPKRDLEYINSQIVHTPLNGKPMLVTDSLNGYMGSLEGVLNGESLSGVTSKQMRNRLRALRDDPGVPLVLVMVDETLDVVIYNVNIYPIPRAGNQVDYYATLDWVIA